MSHDLLDTSWDDPVDGARPRRRWPVRLLVGLGAALVVAYLGAAWWFADRVPPDTTVAGVAVGGQTRADAEATLDEQLAEPTTAPVTLTTRLGSAEIDPADLGVSVDTAATADALTGFSLDPRDLWHHLVGGGPEPAAVVVDDPVFDAAVDELRDELDGEPEEGSLSVAGGEVEYTAPVPGSRVDTAGTAEVLRQQWPGERSLDAATRTIAPTVPASEFERVRTEFAEVAVSGPVTVEAGDESFPLEPADFADAIVLTPEDGTITPQADDEKLLEIVHEAADEAGVEKKAKNAKVTFEGRKPTVKDAVPGVALDDASATAEVWRAISTVERTAQVETSSTEPKWTTEEVTETLPKERISTFTTYFPCCQTRVKNIQKGGKVVDGTYVLPGEQFSLNAVLGDTTTAQSGYFPAPIILNGRTAEAYGGGLSQVSTTVFNAAFFSGMALDAWTPHAYYISRYPEGREATISYPELHMKWTNTTDGGVLIKVKTTDTSIRVDFWGTKKWDIEATKSDRYDIVSPARIVDNDPDCIPQSPVNGFTVDVERIFEENGKVVETEKFTTRYQPEDDVTCTYRGG